VEDGNRRDEKGHGRLERPVRTKIHVKKLKLGNAEATGFFSLFIGGTDIGLDRSTGTRSLQFESDLINSTMSRTTRSPLAATRRQNCEAEQFR